MFLTKSQIALYAQHDDNAEPHPSETIWRDIADLAVAPLLSRCSVRCYAAVISLFFEAVADG
jgi:hypothetical protein